MNNHFSISESHSKRLLTLDGLRFFAAFTVLLAHYSFWVVGDQGVHNSLTTILGTLAGIGMPLFFVLSGFVIHYNYHLLYDKPGGIKKYLVARFTRIYPLYLVLLVIEFAITFHLKRGPCGFAGEKWGFFLALPYYLTLTQDWTYGIIATNNLIYQYHMMSAVAWSVSLEVFFYLFYLLIARTLNKQKSTVIQVTAIATLQIFVTLYLFYCNKFAAKIDHVALIGFGKFATVENGYQDSLMRWLFYFCPLVNLPAFLTGAIIANMHIGTSDKPIRPFEQRYGGLLSFLSIALVLGVHFLFYLHYAPRNALIGRGGSTLIVPLVALMIFCLTRYKTTLINKFLSHSLLVKLGEASYSIYLLHAFFAWYSRDYYYLKLNPWLLYALAISCILLMSRLSYILFERPIQRFLRWLLLGKKKDIVAISPSQMKVAP